MWNVECTLFITFEISCIHRKLFFDEINKIPDSSRSQLLAGVSSTFNT
jgi:hypothetical protein